MDKRWLAILVLIVAGAIAMTVGFILYPASAMNDFGVVAAVRGVTRQD